ncbi:hypothetical protein ABT160_24305 [Streptomyces sp. NPDC001941]|uniref:hypothetical protein n=1 Tax=Streptomyces sp. NPDC001941 TaxID=3154659 RepID=UPI00331DF232
MARPPLRPALPPRARTAVLGAAAALITVAAAAVLESGRWQFYADRHRLALTPRPRRSCPDCQGAGGCWIGGPFPEMEACDCWTNRRELYIRLLPVPVWQLEPPF